MDIRFAREADFEACSALHNKFSVNPRTFDQWRWDFVANLYRTDQIPFVVVDDNGRIAGTQAFIPIRMIDRHGVFWTAKSEETLVDPDYRGQKLFDRMYELLFTYARSKDLRYIWGFTPATKAFTKIGFKIPGWTEQILFPFSARSISSLIESRVLTGGAKSFADRARMVPYKIGAVGARAVAAAKFGRRTRSLARRAAARLETRIESAAPGGAGDLCRRFVAQYDGITIFRDQEYLDWRIFNNPYTRPIMRSLYADDQLLGWIIYSIGDDAIGYLVDIMVGLPEDSAVTAGDVVARLLWEAVIDLKRTGVLAMRGWHVTTHPFDQLVRQEAEALDFFHVRKGHAVVIHSPVQSCHDAIDQNYNTWFITRLFTEGVAG